MKYKSLTYCSKNQDGFPEVELEYKKSFVRSLLGKKQIEKYVKIDKHWSDKKTLKKIGLNMQCELIGIELEFQRMQDGEREYQQYIL